MRSADSLAGALDEAVASCWIALGAQIEGRSAQAPVDVEALIAATARLGDRLDPRVRGVALDWCVRFGSIVSSTRLVRTAREMSASGPVEEFASVVAASGGPAWASASRTATAADVRDRVHVTDLAAPGRLAWRLRAAFGVSARADVLLAVMTSQVPLSVSEIARRTRYAKGAVAPAIAALALAGVVDAVLVGQERRVELAPDSIVRPWTGTQASRWTDQVARWTVAIGALDTIAATSSMNRAVAAIERRAWVKASLTTIVAAGMPRPDLSVLGEGFAVEYERWADGIALVIATG